MDIHGSGLEIPLAVLKDLKYEISVDLFLASEIPPGTGLGSSASVCVNILKTLTSYLRTPISKYELAERAFHIARDVLGHYIGKQDEYAAAFGGLNFITFHRDGSTKVKPLELDPEILRQLQSNLIGLVLFQGAPVRGTKSLPEDKLRKPQSTNPSSHCPQTGAIPSP